MRIMSREHSIPQLIKEAQKGDRACFVPFVTAPAPPGWDDRRTTTCSNNEL